MSIKSRLPALIDDHPLPTWLYDKKDFRVLAANKSATRSFGYTKKAWQKFSIPDFLETKSPGLHKSSVHGIITAKNGQTFIVRGFFKTIAEKRGKLNLLIIHHIESAEDKKDDLETRHSRLEQIVRVSHNEIYLISESTLNFEFANAAALKNLGYSAEEIRSLRLTDLFSFPDELGLNALLNSLRKGETSHLQLQLRYTRKNGSHYDADVRIQMLEKDKLFLLVVSDITDKLITDRKLLDTIREKETLIKEIHHRVKNNLQLISSIIYLKLASLGQSDIRSFLEDTRQKIRSIALIHERLLQTEKIDKVEISDYLGKLVHDLEVTYHRQGLDLKVNTNIGFRMMSLDTAIICGLIVNELLTNAIKHAFNGRTQGQIDIQLTPGADNKLMLSVADDGVSLPQHISPGSSESFGMQLIHVFVKQLNGTVEIIREKGTKFRIEF